MVYGTGVVNNNLVIRGKIIFDRHPLFFPLFSLRMISFVQGKFEEKSPARVVVNVNGVGYELHISLYTYEQIANSESGKLFTYQHITENSQLLFGFAGQDEKSIFLLLISVSGVGAATARMMLSGLKPMEVSAAIMQNNTRLLESVKGIGKKTAERIILELKDKVIKLPPNSATGPGMAVRGKEQDALDALIALGIQRNLAEVAIRKVIESNEHQNIETIIKEALKNV